MLLPDGTRSEQMLNDGVVGLGLAVFPWIFLSGTPAVASMISIVVVIAFAIRFSRIGVRKLVLTSNRLVLEQKSSHTSMVLDQITEVQTEWIYKGPTVCHIRSSSRDIEVRVTDEAKAFLAKLGSQLEPYRRQIHARPSACELLGWPPSPTQMD